MNVPLAVVFLSLLGALPALAQAGTVLSSQELELAAPSDLTWTDPRDISAVLVIPAPMEGDFLVLDEEGHRVVQLLKRPGQPLALGFAPGRYRVLRQQDRQISQARFTLREGRRLELTPWSFGGYVWPALQPGDAWRGSPFIPWFDDEVEGIAIRVIPERVVLPVAASLFLREWSTNTWLAGEAPVENGFALGVVNGGTTLRWGALGLVGNWYEEEARGVLVAGVGNRVFGDSSGLQVSGGINRVEGRFDGAQVTWGLNVANKGMWGLQVAGVGNVTELEPQGLGESFGMRGAQVSLGGNFSMGDTIGLQVAGLSGNLSEGRMTGVQVAPFFNHATHLWGLQVALLNSSLDVTGVQVGLINTARSVKGSQIGLLNFSNDMQGVPLGLFSFERDAPFHLETWASDLQLLNLAMKFGGHHTYTTLLAGLGPDDRLRRYSLGLGWGGHVLLGKRFWLDVDVTGSVVRRTGEPFWRGANVLAQGRLMLGFNIFERLAVFAGPTYNTYFAWRDEDRLTLTTLPIRQRQVDERTTLQHWPGVQLGVRI